MPNVFVTLAIRLLMQSPHSTDLHVLFKMTDFIFCNDKTNIKVG